MTNRQLHDRLLELLADQATVGLNVDEKAELDQLLNSIGIEDDYSLDLVVNFIAEGQNQDPEQRDDMNLNDQTHINALPEHLRNRVLSEATQHLASSSDHATDAGQELSRGDQQATTGNAKVLRSERGQGPGMFSKRELLAWFVSAACIVIACFAWFARPEEGIDKAQNKIASLIESSSSNDLGEFLREVDSKDLFEVKLNAGPHESGKLASGTVYWNRKTKRGFVKLDQLTPNDSSKEQYQLWVIDRQRGIEDRPNAGVFDVTESGNSVFAFRSDLEVFDAQGFAITVEKPGGVNKSDLSKIALLNLGT